MERMLLHMCCGPCTVYPWKVLRDRYEVTGLFFNPNIHPYTEYRQRMETAQKFAEEEGFRFIVIDEYNLEEFLRNCAFREQQRCVTCYGTRLDRAASVAKSGKFDCFSSTLLVSPFQKHDLIRQVGENAGKKYGVPFYYEDFRPGFKEGTEISKERGMYRQQYCGCIYSEKERYLGKPKAEKRR